MGHSKLEITARSETHKDEKRPPDWIELAVQRDALRVIVPV